MSIDEFIDQAFLRLPVVPVDDRDSVERSLTQNFERGFSLDDAVMFEYYSEEVSPHFEEEYALARMKEITDKYPQFKKDEIIL